LLASAAVVIIWGENTLCEMVRAAWAVEKVYKESKAAGQVGHTLEVVEMPGAKGQKSLFILYPFICATRGKNKIACLFLFIQQQALHLLESDAEQNAVEQRLGALDRTGPRDCLK
jgi:hypothetical protein